MTYRVWIAQINQTYLDVKAKDVAGAIKAAKSQWFAEEATPKVLDCMPLAKEKQELKRR